jgi:hypothetical protein
MLGQPKQAQRDGCWGLLIGSRTQSCCRLLRGKTRIADTVAAAGAVLSRLHERRTHAKFASMGGGDDNPVIGFEQLTTLINVSCRSSVSSASALSTLRHGPSLLSPHARSAGSRSRGRWATRHSPRPHRQRKPNSLRAARARRCDGLRSHSYLQLLGVVFSRAAMRGVTCDGELTAVERPVVVDRARTVCGQQGARSPSRPPRIPQSFSGCPDVVRHLNFCSEFDQFLRLSLQLRHRPCDR